MRAKQSAVRRILAGAAAFLAVSAASAVTAPPAAAAVPPEWQHKTNICQSVSFYGQNPAYNDGLTPIHALGGYKKFYFTTGPVVKGWMPVYSAGQEYWHTGWVRSECMAAGWGYPETGYIIY